MLLTKMISNILISTNLLFGNLDYFEIKPQNNIDNLKTFSNTNEGLNNLIKSNDLIFYGETHNQLEDKLQLEILLDYTRRYSTDSNIFLGLEMVSSDKQRILDEFNNNKIDSSLLMNKLNWDNNWRYLKDGYQQVFDNARFNKIKLVGLNSPETINEMFRDDLSFNKNFIENDNLISFIKTIGEYHNLSDKKLISKFYQINLLWETWMASEIENYLRIYPNSKMIVWTGAQHSKSNGIPKILSKVYKDYNFKLINITPLTDEDYFGKVITKK